ncbi:MAG: hypothetical protein A3I07_00705 [Candidatus Doudnabacteria bacterium RIFCSPLOWO2_02_FULL_42_9]|uniref:Sortase n=1 Tax=Candidatus Doudnabacteria bacterium RIFCSPHIGHO2_01_FULL_41_86 TaxID=1817821 RepID=A0A1F5NA25_9BACT|nr:MAG: hypothetical protein A2717_02715 [Candidatus Doudnabacteria bacterium RIFCSPHIGHO2_01_FULL_41_86]OGE75504.1 MAG: hypothetical protein A3K07_01045 [Candidatus Doudnabacteria bacterium RIFCSPHIGHO2_01_43_10]OGE85461.1 MAG: hypothetical protein A3E28_02285 [Candidatus Doudnabacteria bacterium RIFCSPHIGHO2_12_FULL_42_22]OGE86999.1 MAG: hypothetical protein A3C49_03120 [Candidatus Doudnabacteria bacterium RIFCSPHIGHO2_02_FULL_42_25]OGE92598.1 MAG: hypothetical protein A2895_03275 [Candidatus
MIKYIFKVLFLLVAIIVVLNWDYVYKNIDYVFFGKIENTPNEPTDENLVEPNLLVIDSLAVKAPIIYATDNDEKKFQEDLRKGVVHFPDTAVPGESGNVYIFGHSSDYLWSKGDYKTVFATLPNIDIGAKIIISDHAGRGYTYEVKEKKVVDAKDLSVLQQDESKYLLTLQTSYPIGTAWKRYIVIAELKK